MRSATVFCLAAAALSGSALADGRDWSGFYAGAHSGYGWGQNRLADDNPAYFYEIDPGGVIGGGQLGYNYQFGAYLIGLEGDATIGALDKRMDPADAGGAFDEVSIEVDYLASVRLRFGMVFDDTLIYATGGVGFAAWTDRNFIGGSEFGDGADHDRTGWTAGLGVEHGVAEQWTAKVEYLHYGFDDEIQPPAMFWYIGADNFESSFDTVKVGLNYHF